MHAAMICVVSTIIFWSASNEIAFGFDPACVDKWLDFQNKQARLLGEMKALHPAQPLDHAAFCQAVVTNLNVLKEMYQSERVLPVCTFGKSSYAKTLRDGLASDKAEIARLERLLLRKCSGQHDK